jgi:FkbM family methyltransferase
MKLLARLLRAARTAMAEALGAAVATAPILERPFIAAGTRVARWHYPGTVYWESHQALARRLRISGRRFRTLDILGHPITLDVTDSSAYLRYFHAQPYEPELTAFIVKDVRPGSVFVDVGANIGLFTLLAARCASPGGRVLAFEPHPDARARMQHLLALNGLTEVVTVSGAALSDRSAAAAPLFLSSESVLSTLDPAAAPLGDAHPFRTSVEVPLSSLDDWLEASGPAWTGTPIDVMKIDVEGTEERVLRGMVRTLARNPSLRIVCETTPGSAADHLLKAAGFSARPLDPLRGSCGNYLYCRGVNITQEAGGRRHLP